jgi:hypothetical protein
MTPNAWEINSEKGLAARCQKICLLGEGGFGTVHKVVYDDAKVSSLDHADFSWLICDALSDIRLEDDFTLFRDAERLRSVRGVGTRFLNYLSRHRLTCPIPSRFYAQKLSHENLVQVHAVEHDLPGGKTHILMEVSTC